MSLSEIVFPFPLTGSLNQNPSDSPSKLGTGSTLEPRPQAVLWPLEMRHQAISAFGHKFLIPKIPNNSVSWGTEKRNPPNTEALGSKEEHPGRCFHQSGGPAGLSHFPFVSKGPEGIGSQGGTSSSQGSLRSKGSGSSRLQILLGTPLIRL